MKEFSKSDLISIVSLIASVVIGSFAISTQSKLQAEQNRLSSLAVKIDANSNDLQQQNNTINQLIAQYTESQAQLANTSFEYLKRQTYFETKNKLNQDIEQAKYDELKSKLDHKETIKNTDLLKNYLNNFEEIYLACQRGIVPKPDIKMSFEYLLGDICSNHQVVEVSKSGYGGLKKLCGSFFPTSKIAITENNSCN